MAKTLTIQECKSKLFNAGLKLGVSPTLISTRLLSKEDKQDMLNGLIPDETLFVAVKCWMEAEMPDYANGHTDPYRAPEAKSEPMYRPDVKKPPYKRFNR